MKSCGFLSIVFVVFVFAMPHMAFAQQVTEQFKKPMPKVEFMPAAEFEAQTDLITEKMPDDLALSYSMRVPKNWKASGGVGAYNITVGNKVLTELKTFFGPPSVTAERSKLVIDAVGLDYGMTAEQWFMQYLLANGYNLQGLEVYDKDNAEALYVLIDNNISYAVRSVARMNGKRVLFAQHYIPVERWHDEKVMQAQMLDSFRPINDVEVHVEEMESFQFLDIAEFQYPTTWTLRALPIRSIDRMKVEIIKTAVVETSDGKPQTRLDGQIDVEMASIFASDTLEEEIEKFRSALADKGLVLGDVIEIRDDFLLGDRFDFVDTQVYKVTDVDAKLIEHELWVTIMAAGDYYYFVTLFTPSRDHDYFLWGRNVETYKLITSLIEPKGDTVADP